MAREFVEFNSTWDQSSQKGYVGRPAQVKPNCQIRIINKSGADVYIGQVLDPVRVYPTLSFGSDLEVGSDDLNLVHTEYYTNSLIMECEVIDADTRQVVVATSAIPNNGSGVGFIAGVCTAIVRVDNVADLTSLTPFAKIEAASQNLVLNTTEGYRILWVSTDYNLGSDPDNLATAVIDLAMGGGAAATLDVVQAVADGTLGAIPTKLLTLKADLSLSPNYTVAATSVTCAYFKL